MNDYKGWVKKCGECGVVFFTKWHGTKSCSDQCKYLRQSELRNCMYCKEEFRGIGRKYCNDNCEKKSRRELKSQICQTCNSPFNHHNLRKYCNPTCFPSNIVDTDKPGKFDDRGVYVYGWFDGDSPFPFYVGCGQDKRAWCTHRKSGEVAPCQRMREQVRDFRVVMFRRNLTKEGAALVESVLIDYFGRFGTILTNQVSGLTRKDRPPLEYPLESSVRVSKDVEGE